jgi:hypothetical protein
VEEDVAEKAADRKAGSVSRFYESATARFARFFLGQHTKTEKYGKLAQSIPNGRKVD